MRISELKNEKALDPDVMTINDMYDYCWKAMDKGLGNRILMIPNADPSEIAYHYRCISKYFDLDDGAEQCAYLEVLSEEEEKFVCDKYFQYY